MNLSGPIFLAALLFFGWTPRIPAQELSPKEFFSSGYALHTTGKSARAKELLQKAVDPKFTLADYSLRYLSAIAFGEKNWDQARSYALQLRQQYPQSLWYAQAELQLIKIDLAEKKHRQALASLRALRANKNAKNEILQEALLLEAQLQDNLGEPQQAFALYRDLRAGYPNSRWTDAARREQSRLRERYPEQFALSTPTAIADEADRLAREAQHGEAENLYKRLLANNPDGEFRLRLLVKLAALYMSIVKRNEAIPLLEQIARDYPEAAEAPRALYQAAQILWNRHDNAQALEYFKAVIDRFPKSSYIDRAHFALGDIYEYFGNRELAIQYYTSVPKQFPKSNLRSDALWRLAWLYYRAADWPQAQTTFASLSQTGDSSFRTAALYWQARSAEKLNDQETARQLHRRIINGGEESYYQALSQQRLGLPPSEARAISTSTTMEADPPITPEVNFHFNRARELLSLSLHRLAVAELDEVERLSRKHARLRPVLMREYFRGQAYGRSLTIANQLPGSVEDRDRFRFPLAYWSAIQKKAQEREIDPFLVLSLIRQESLFDARARSPVFALGLMQLLPSTAARVAKEIGLEPPSNEKLFEPETNLTLGMQYLRDLLQRYSNNWYKAIAAYNAGEGAVDRWEREIVTDDIEEFVERIPYIETRGYVKLVMRNHRIYKKLYKKNS
ncbi:MAG: tetratricopeptide repeat protein [Deltaproteobacteria bacterium]|nr:tetratricopeptide repeat protein [Deltaproteobacteria bacterium]